MNLANGTLTTQTGEAQQIKMRRVETPDDATQTYTYRALVPVQALDKTKVSFRYEQDAELFFHPLPESCTLTENKAEVFTTTLPFTVHTVPIPAGQFLMKIPNQLHAPTYYEHEVHMSAFRMGKYEVTNAQFCEFLNAKGAVLTTNHVSQWVAAYNGRALAADCRSFVTPKTLTYKTIDGKGKWVPYEEVESGQTISYANHPVTYVSWHGAGEFTKWRGGRLPTHAEWQYACRAGTSTDYVFGNDPAMLGDYAWYADNSGMEMHPVGLKKATPWGLYDVHGNASELIYDFLSRTSVGGTLYNPVGVIPNDLHVNQNIHDSGGNIYMDAQFLVIPFLGGWGTLSTNAIYNVEQQWLTGFRIMAK